MSEFITYEQLMDETLGIESIDESVILNKHRIDVILKEIITSYSDNGIKTPKNHKLKLKLHNTKLERNVYTGDIFWDKNKENNHYFASIINKIKNDLRIEGFNDTNIDTDGKVKINISRADINRINKKYKDDVTTIATTGAGTAAKVVTGGLV